MHMRTTGGLICFEVAFMDSTDEIKQPKPAKTYEEQLGILKSRGLYADDEISAINQLLSLTIA